MAKYPKVKADLFAEIIPAVEEAKEDIIQNLSYDTVVEFNLLQRCFYESLRLESPIPVSTSNNMSKDLTINGVTFKKETQF